MRSWPNGQLPRLALCLRPPDHFAEDLAALADRFGCPPAALADLVPRATGDEPFKGSPRSQPRRSVM
jgi:hypothetical protein